MRDSMRLLPCDNLNHRRQDPPTGYCPTCGEVVNPRRTRPQCSESSHAAARRERFVYCVDCGARLISEHCARRSPARARGPRPGGDAIQLLL